MGEHTEIGWTDHTFNPWHGCTKVSAACDNCYAEAFSKRTGRAEWGDDAERWFPSEAYWQHPFKWDAKAAAAGVRRRVFCASMADVFEDRDDLLAQRDRLFATIALTQNLDWLLLTKRPENIVKLTGAYGRLDTNVWLGTTVEDQERAEERIPSLAAIPATVRFLSCEPLLGPVNLAPWLRRISDSAAEASPYQWDTSHRIDWVIAGGESGHGARPMHIDWVRSIRDECYLWDVPFFFKQWGGTTPKAGGKQLDGREWCEFPEVARA